MSVDFFRKLTSALLFSLVQVLILNHIHLFGFATPLLYVYFVLMFRRNYPKWGILLWSFAMGVVLDTFTNTPGVAAASLTMIGALQPYTLAPFIPRDSAADLAPSMATIGVMRYCYYAFILVFLFNLMFFTLEMFSFFNWLYWLKCVLGSTFLTVVLLLVMENVKSR